MAGRALRAWPEAGTASLRGPTGAVGRGPDGECHAGALRLLRRWWRRQPRQPLRRILSWASGCGLGMKSRLGRGGRDGLDTWLARVAGRPLAHSQLVPRAQEGAKVTGRFFRRFRQQSRWRRIRRGSWECRASPTGGCACQLVTSLG